MFLGYELDLFIESVFKYLVNDLIYEILNLIDNQSLILMALFICFNIINVSIYVLLALPLLGSIKNHVNF